MKVIVRGRGLSVPVPIRARVEAKVGKVTQLLSKLREARVVLVVEKYRRLAEVTLLAKHHVVHCAEATHDLRSAVDLALSKLEHQVRRIKDRTHDPKPRASLKRGLRGPGGEQTSA